MRRLWSVLLLVAALTAASAAPVIATDRTTVDDSAENVEVLYDDGQGKVIWQEGDWVRRTHLEPLTYTYKMILKGRWDGKACVFEYEEVFEAGSEETAAIGFEIVEREIGINEKTCEMELEGGKRQISSTELKAVAEPGGVGGGGAEASGGSGSRAMWQRIAVVDPVSIDVSWSKAGQSYSWNGICVTNQYNITASEGYAWVTGWYRTLWSKTSSGDVCSPYVWRRVKVYHNNLAFCSPVFFTYSRLYANEVRGYPNGNWGYYYSFSYWGDCSALLHFERTKSP